MATRQAAASPGALLLLLGPLLGVSGCTPHAAPAGGGAAPRELRYDGVGGSGEVRHERQPGGRELLRGRLELARGALGEPRAAVVEEHAALDAQGRLEQLEVVLTGPGGRARYTLARREGRVHIEQSGEPASEWRVPDDAPWLYAPADRGGAVPFTPVAAWIALRAVSAASVVRVLVPELRESHLVAADQVAVATERGATLALGAGADADADFVSEVRWREGQVALRRAAAAAGPREPGAEPHSS